MQQYHTDLLSIDKRLEKLKLYFEHLQSSLVRLRPQYENLMDRHLESAEPWVEEIKEYKPSFRGLEIHGRTLKPVLQKLLVFFLIVLFVVTWANFLRQDEMPFTIRRPDSDNSVFNTTLGVCPPATTLYNEVLANFCGGKVPTSVCTGVAR